MIFTLVHGDEYLVLVVAFQIVTSFESESVLVNRNWLSVGAPPKHGYPNYLTVDYCLSEPCCLTLTSGNSTGAVWRYRPYVLVRKLTD